jgi:large subunit ribosomal protein L7/L12
MAAKSYEKLIDEIGNMSVLELAEFVKALEDKLGVSAAMPMMSAGAAPATPEAQPQQEEKSQFKVTLQPLPENVEKVQVIKALRKVMPELNLSDAKKVVDNAPAVIAESAPKDKAMEIKKELEAAGAKVVLA